MFRKLSETIYKSCKPFILSKMTADVKGLHHTCSEFTHTPDDTSHVHDTFKEAAINLAHLGVLMVRRSDSSSSPSTDSTSYISNSQLMVGPSPAEVGGTNMQFAMHKQHTIGKFHFVMISPSLSKHILETFLLRCLQWLLLPHRPRWPLRHRHKRKTTTTGRKWTTD
jgi:hypothetical protein